MNRPVRQPLPPAWPALFAPAAARIFRQTAGQRHVCFGGVMPDPALLPEVVALDLSIVLVFLM